MMQASLFAPLDLPAAVEEVRRTQGANGVVDLLVVSLTDRRVRSDADIDAQLDTLKAACRQTRRYREAIPVLERIAELSPARRNEVAAELAVVHWHLGEAAKAVALLESAVTREQQLTPARRSLAFSLVAEAAALMLRQTVLAQQCAVLGRTTGTTAPAKTSAKTKAAPTTARTERTAPATANERPATPARAERPAASRRRSGLARPVLSAEPALLELDTPALTPAVPAEPKAPRRRTGLARPVLAAQTAFDELDLDDAVTTRPILTLIAGSAA